MIKKIILSILMLCAPTLVLASSSSQARIGGEYYDTLEEALVNASSNDTIKLTSNVILNNTLNIDKVANIDLNGKNISADTAVFKVQGGTLNLTGSGTIKETKPNYGAIRVIGSTDTDAINYSNVNIGENVTLEGWAGIFITHESSKSYGVVINIEGKIKAVSDISGSEGIGIYVNGMLNHINGSPIINIKDGAVINSNGLGLYNAGYATLNIGKATITGIEAGIGIKAGVLNINGAIVTCTGANKTPTEGNNNGMNASGTAIQIESNSGYKGQIELNISNGIFKSKNSKVVYEYIGKGTTTQVKSMSISNGTFISEAGKNVFSFSEDLSNTHKHFISGGEFSSNPNIYLKSGYSSAKDGSLYKVTASTLQGVFKENPNNSSNTSLKTIIIFALIGIFSTIYYFNKDYIKRLIKRYI